MNLVLAVAGSNASAGLQWTLTYPTGTIASISIVSGPALTAVGKTVACGAASGSVTCVATGLNATPIASGTVATATVTLGTAAGGSVVPISMIGALGASPAGIGTTIAGSGGTVTVLSGITGLLCSPSTLASNSTSTCTVTLTQAAPAGGAVVTLSSNNTSLTVPASVTVAAAATTASFNATTGTLASNQTATVTATYNRSTGTASISLAPVLVSSLACNPSSLGSNSTSACTVTLTKAAPAGGALVTLSSNNTSLTVPASVTGAAAATTASFNATTGTLASNQTATVTATYNSSTGTASISLVASVLVSSLACSPSSLGPNSTSACTVTLTQAAPAGGAVVTLSSNNSVLTVPSSVTVAAAATSGSFSATTAAISTDQSVTVTASLNSGSRTTVVTVIPTPPTVSSVTCSPTTLSSGTSTSCTVTLSAAAPAGGVVVTLTASNPALFTVLPASVAVGASSTTAVFSATAASISTKQTVTITASLNGTSAKVTLTIRRHATSEVTGTVNPPAEAPSEAGVTNLYCLPRSVRAGAGVSCELHVPATAAPQPLAIGSSSQEVRIPALVTARPNQTQVTFRASIDPAAKQQTAAITATSGDTRVQDTVAVVLAQGPVLRVASTHLVKPGETLSFAVTAVDPNDLPVQLAATGLPAGASFDAAIGQFDWTPNASQAGKYEVAFSAVDSAGQSSTARVSVEAGKGVPVLSESQELACSPNAIASLSGKWLAASLSSVSDPTGATMELGGTQVSVNGQLAQLVFSSTRKVQFVCPALPPGTPLSVVVETASGTTPKSLVGTMREAAPRILSLEDAEGAQGVVSFAGSADLAMPRNAGVPAHPAQPGDTIRIWTTGLSPDAESQPATVSATVGGVDVAIQSIQAAPGYAGVYIVQLGTPNVLGDTVRVQIRVITPAGQLLPSNTVSIAIEAGSD